MTRVTLGRQRLELAGSAALVACVAIDRRMGPSQRKPVVVLLNLLDRDLPSSNGVALLAVGAELPFVNIRVAILTTLPNVAEDCLDMTLSTGHRSVHAPQGILRLIVVKLGYSANWFPRVGRMAVLAWNIETPMRTVRATRSLC